MAGLAAIFERAKAAGRGTLIAYVCAGDPDLETTALTIDALTAAGVDLIELGVPYSDPLADGPTIAAASQRALEGGTRLPAVLELAASACRRGANIVLFGYFNPILRFGVARFADTLRGGGALGAIVPDVPLEETGELRAEFDGRGLALPLLVAPTTPPGRAREIAARSTGFTYLVSRLGVTGAGREPDFAWIGERVRELRPASSLPLAVGFGISTPAHVRRACALADGAIVGSALIDALSGLRGPDAAQAAGRFAAGLRAGTLQEGETVPRI
jgi:tryptophan synthase alpha chain